MRRQIDSHKRTHTHTNTRAHAHTYTHTHMHTYIHAHVSHLITPHRWAVHEIATQEAAIAEQNMFKYHTHP